MNKQLNSELKNFYLFLAGQFVSQSGSKMTSYGLVLWSYGQTGSVLSTSLLTVCMMIPSVLLSFISGSISDRWDKKKIMLCADSFAAVFSVIVWILLWKNFLKVEYLYVINIMLGIADSFQNSASDVAVSLMVSEENYMRTSGLRSLSSSVISIFYPVLATSVYAMFGLNVIVTIDILSFLFAFVTLAFIVKIPELKTHRDEESWWQQCISGMQYIRRHNGISALIMFMAFVNIEAGLYSANLTPMVLLRNGGNEIELGIVSGAIGVAGVTGSILVGRLPTAKNRVTVIINTLSFSFIVCDTLLGIGRSYYVWTIAVFAGNLLIPVMNANLEYIMRTKVPVEMQGRVFSARNTLQYSAIPVGYLAGGILSDYIFEPLMETEGRVTSFFTFLTGGGSGSGIASLYIITGVLAFSGCCLFRFHKGLRSLDE